MAVLSEDIKKCINGAYCNREYSWLQFDKRVLDQADDKANPLFERCKFLSIFISNLDEFIQVRLGTLINEKKNNPEIRENKTQLSADEQIKAILAMLPSLYKSSEKTFRSLKRELYKNNINLVRPDALSLKQREEAEVFFDSLLLPRLSPVVMDVKHPLFRLQNLAVYLLVQLEKNGSERFGLAKLSPSSPSLCRLPGGNKVHLITSDDLMEVFAEKIFPGFNIKNRALIRVTRNADFDATTADADDEYGFDFSRLVRTMVEERTTMDVIRLELSSSISEESRAFIIKQAGVKKSHVFTLNTYFQYKFLFALPTYLSKDRAAKLLYSEFKPLLPRSVSLSSDLIQEVRRKDMLLAYPYQSMDVLVRLLNQCADSPLVTSIKITIYRLAGHSRITEALLRAAENGKEVVAVMELCARFDEQNNLANAHTLADAGCTVFYGVDDYKVHSKLISITLEENGVISHITHIGTGNYNESTAKQYTDLNLITANEEIGNDAASIFRDLAVLNLEFECKKLLASPYSLKPALMAEFDREIAKGENGLIRAKFNSLTDKEFIEKLIEASRAGVKVNLVVRGICCLIPGVKGVSENITIHSVVGRFLEHSRIYAFGDGDDARVYIASADLMTRNLHRRVEVAAPVLDQDIKRRILHILFLILNDNVKGRMLSEKGVWKKLPPSENMINSQEQCIKEAVLL